MITHIVLLHPKEGIPAREIHEVLEHVCALKETIPGIMEVQTGENLSGNHQGYTYGFIMRFVDKDHLNAYAPHPAHQRVSGELVAMCHRILDFDLE